MARRKHWYTRRTVKDAPSEVHDQAHTPESIWATGYNAAVQNYLDEIRDVLREEGYAVGDPGDRFILD